MSKIAEFKVVKVGEGEYEARTKSGRCVATFVSLEDAREFVLDPDPWAYDEDPRVSRLEFRRNFPDEPDESDRAADRHEQEIEARWP